MVIAGEYGTLDYLLRNERSFSAQYLIESEEGLFLCESVIPISCSLYLINEKGVRCEKIRWRSVEMLTRIFMMLKAMKYPLEKGFKARDQFYTPKITKSEMVEKIPEYKELIDAELSQWRYDKEKRLWCLHCEKSFMTTEILHNTSCYAKPKGLIQCRMLCCPTKGCDGTPLDWKESEWKH